MRKRKLLKDKAMSEDEVKKENEIQKMTDDYIKKVDMISDEKEKNILTI